MHQITKYRYYLLLLVVGFNLCVAQQANGGGLSAFVPYQNKCSELSLRYNTRVKNEIQASKTEAQSTCVTCSQKQSSTDSEVIRIASGSTTNTIQNRRNNTKDSNIHPACFFASMTQEYPTEFSNYNCKESTQRNPYRNSTKPCFNKDYVDMTKKAFDEMTDCFGFNSNEKKKLFSLFNHESHFSLNNKSHTDARCYGQITLTTFQEVSKHIYIDRNRDVIHKQRTSGLISKKSDIYSEVTNKCPDIEQKAGFLPAVMGKMNPKQKAQNQYDAYERVLGIPKGVVTALAISCSTILNPYNCLFYSLYNMRLNMQALENAFKKGYPKKSLEKTFADHNMDLSTKQGRMLSKIKKDFSFPLSANEVLTFEGKTKDRHTGKVKKRTWVFADEYEAYRVMKTQEYGTSKLGKAKIQKVQVFKNTNPDSQKIDEDIKWAILNTAYNGGISITDKYIELFMDNQRLNLSDNYCNKKATWAKKLCNNRKNLFKNQSRSVADFKATFKDFLKRKYGTQNDSSIRDNAPEVAKFQSAIEKDDDYLKNNKNNLTAHLNQMHEIKKGKSQQKNNSTTKKDIDQFVQFVKNNCP